jgi:DNA-binding protein HU-beta
MNKGELIKELADVTGYTQKDAAAFLDAYVEVITKALKAGDKVQLVGFGTYEVKKRAAGVRTNPQTKEKVQVPATTVPAFKFGKAYKNLFN